MLNRILTANNRIIINTDLDGILSGLVLHNVYKSEIVGFSNSDDCVWIDLSRAGSIHDAVYIDMFVANPDVACIDQHIVAADDTHWQMLRSNPLKLNPNLLNKRTFFGSGQESYYMKYPFGTVHFLCALIDHPLGIDLNATTGIDGLRVGDFFLRADDALTTTLASQYMENARQWWQWLADYSPGNPNIEACREYLKTVPAENVREIRQKIGNYLQGTFNCESKDGGFKTVTTADGKLRGDVVRYINFVAGLIDMPVFGLDGTFTAHKGKTNRIMFTRDKIPALIQRGNLFSYGFVKSPGKDGSFSYTYGMESAAKLITQ